MSRINAEVLAPSVLPPVLFEERTTQNGKCIGIAKLNAEKTLHAISLEMVDLLDPQLPKWASDPQIAILVIQVAGEKYFCAGGDLQHLYQTMLAHPCFRRSREYSG